MLGSFDHLEETQIEGMHFSERIRVDGGSIKFKDSDFSLMYVVQEPIQGKEGSREGYVELHVEHGGVTNWCHTFHKEDLDYLENLVITLTQALWDTTYEYNEVVKFNRDVIKRSDAVYQSVTNTDTECSFLYYVFIDREGEKYVQLFLSECPRANKTISDVCLEFGDHNGNDASFFLRMLEDLRTVTRGHTSSTEMHRVVFTSHQEARKAANQQDFTAWSRENVDTPIILYIPIPSVQEETKTGRLKVSGNPAVFTLGDLSVFQEQRSNNDIV